MIGTIRSAVASWPTVAEGKLKKLGKAGSFEYATYKDVEYAITARPVNPAEHDPGPGEILITAEIEEMIDGHRWGSTVHYRGFPVLSALPSLHRKEPTRIATERRATSATMGALKAAIASDARAKNPNAKPPPVTEPPPVIETGGSTGAERSPAGYVAWLQSRGVELTVAKGRLLPMSAKPLGLEERVLIAEAEELLVGHLTGKPTPCSMCDLPAVSIAFPHAPLCGEHLEAER
jgi:hypothetical protein